MSWRKLAEKHFGPEAVLWAINDGPIPSEAELQRRALEGQIRCFTELCIERAQVRRVLAMIERGEETGLTAAEAAMVPELLALLEEKIEAERARALAVYE